MTREILWVILACALWPLAGASGAEPVAAPDEATRAGLVREVLDQSRLLEDARFTIPLDYWEVYLRDQAESRGGALPAPVALLAEEGIYHLWVPARKPPVLRATVRLHVFRAKACANTAVLWAKAPGGWETVAVNGKATALPEVDGWLRFSPPEPGDYIVTAAASLNDYHAVALLIPRTVRTSLEYELLGAMDVAVAGDSRRIRGAAGDGTGTANEGTRGTLALSPREKLEFTVNPRGPATVHAPTFEVRGDVAWNFDAAGQTVAAALELAIVGGKTETVDLALPSGATRLTVTGPDVREARPGEGEGGAVRVFLHGAVTERTRLEATFQLPAVRSGVQTVGGIAVRRGHWSGGTVVVTSTGGGSEAVQDSATGLAEIALADVPASAAARLAGPAALAYQVTGREWSAGVELLNLGEFALRESIADVAHYELLLCDDGSMMCRARYEIRNRSKQFLRVELPAGATAVLARVNEQSRPLAAVAGERDAYLLPLVRSKASLKGLLSFPVEIVALYRVKPLGAAGEAALPLPRIDLPIAYAKCEAYVPWEMKPLKWAGVLQQVVRYGDEAGGETFGYGHGEAAEKPAAVPLTGSVPVPGRLSSPPAGPTTATTTFWGRIHGGAPAATTVDGTVSDDIQNIPHALASNYYRAGNEFYEKGDYENARKSLENVAKLAPGSVEAGNSLRLLSNTAGLELGQSQVQEGATASFKGAMTAPAKKEPAMPIGGGLDYKGLSKEQKAAAAEVKGELNEANRKLLEQQEQLLERGQTLAQQGKKVEAVDQFRAATALGEELAGRGADVREQKSRLRVAKEEIAQADKDREVVMKDQKKFITESEMKSRTTRRPVSGEVSSFTLKETDSPVPAAPSNGLKTVEVIGVGGGGGGGALFTEASPAESNRIVYKVQAAPAPQSAAPPPPAPAEVPPPQQVQLGANIALQRAANSAEFRLGVPAEQPTAGVADRNGPPLREYFVQDLVTPSADFGGSGVNGRDLELRGFLFQNYGWLYSGQGQGGSPPAPALGDLAQKLNWNLGQKVAVNSLNLNVDPAATAALGITFQAGANGVNYALIDEAQFRTLAQLPPASGPASFGETQKSQEAIVGTDALLANGWRGNVAYAADRFNRLDVHGNAVDLPHEKYLLINNGGYLTAVRTGAMQFWKEKATPFQFAAAPQEINVPRVGQVVKFEKTLVKPTDDLVIRTHYEWKGTVQ